jgi:hypothetical protein
MFALNYWKRQRNNNYAQDKTKGWMQSMDRRNKSGTRERFNAEAMMGIGVIGFPWFRVLDFSSALDVGMDG